MVGHAAVVLPLPLAAPAREREDAGPVAQVIDGVILAPDILETYAVEAHIRDHIYLVLDAPGGVAEEDVVGPSAAEQQEFAAVEPIGAVAVFIQAALYAAYPEGRLRLVAYVLAFFQAKLQAVHFGTAEVAAPPDARVLDFQCLDFVGVQTQYAFFSGIQGDGDLEAEAFRFAVQDAAEGGVRKVAKPGADFQRGAVRFLGVIDGVHPQLVQRNFPAGDERDGAHDADTPVRRGRIPVHEANREFAFAGPLELD